MTTLTIFSHFHTFNRSTVGEKFFCQTNKANSDKKGNKKALLTQFMNDMNFFSVFYTLL